MSSHQWNSIVRDYEIDMQGIVNHANYVNYLEVCRNNYARSLGVDLWDFHQKGYDFVVVGINMLYKYSLRYQDQFYVTASLSRASRLKINFDQEIRKNDHTLVLVAQVTCVCIDIKRKKPVVPNMLWDALERNR